MSIDFYLDEGNDDFVFRCQQLAPPRILALMQAEADFLRAMPETAESVLDIGCGSGRVLESLAGRARVLAGIDLVCANLGHSRRRLPGREVLLLQGDALHMPFADAAFAVSTVMINTLGNFGDAKVSLLAEMRRVSRVVVAGCYSTAAADAQREWYGVLHARGYLGAVDEARSTPYLCVTSDGYHSERFDEARLTALFEAAGMACEVTRPISELLLVTGTAP
jgi:SAM-dependent methyltransferase